MAFLSIKIQGYKCFDDPAGFDDVKRVNLIIGKNNSGKSSLLDMVSTVCSKDYKFDSNTWRTPRPPSISFEAEVDHSTIQRVFPDNMSGGEIGQNHRHYGLRLVGRRVTWSKWKDQRGNVAKIDSCDCDQISPPIESLDNYADRLAK